MTAALGSRRPPADARGLTLLELMIGLFLAGIVAAAAGFIIFANQRSFREISEKVDLQREITRCVEQISRDVRRSRWVDYIGPTEIVTRDHLGNDINRYYVASSGGSQKIFQTNNTLSDYTCTVLSFTINPDTTTITLVVELMDSGENRVKLESKATLRNRNYVQVGGGLSPAIGHASPGGGTP